MSILSKLDEPCLRISQGMSLCPSITSADSCSLIAASVSSIFGRSASGFSSSERTTCTTAQQTMHAAVNVGSNICDDFFVIQFAFEIAFDVLAASLIFTKSFHAQRYKLRVSA